MAVPESDLRSYFEARRSEWERPARVDVSEIVVTAAVGPRDVPAGDDARTQDEARTKAQALKRLVDDGADFGELARRHSEAASAGYAGRIGWVVAGRFARPYEEAALGLQAGETSAVLETPDGFVLLRVTARDDGRPVAFEDVQEEILTRFLREDPGALTRRYRTYVEELRARHPFELEGLPEGDNQQAEDAGNDGGSIPPG